MKRSKQIGAAVMTAACILLLVWISRPAQADIDYTKYAAAARDISAGTCIMPEDIMMIDLPTGSLTADYCTSIDQVNGLAMAVDVSAGELFNANQLRSKPKGIDYPFQGAGTRLMTLELPAGAANGFWLAAGSRVDIDMIARSPDAEQPIVSLENVEVVSVLSSDGMNVPADMSTTAAKPLICLALSRAEALLLAEGLTNRQISLSVICS